MSSDTISNLSQSFDSRNAGARALLVNAGYVISDGNGGNNYTVELLPASGAITQAPLTINAVPDTKTYDGTTASLQKPTASGLVDGGTISNLSQAFDSRNAGSRTLVIDSGYTINDGNSGGNYTVTVKTATGAISKVALKLQAVPDVKVFDNTTISKKTPQAIGLAAGDTVSNLTQAFDKKTPGIRTLLVNNGYVINDGNNGQNYTVTTATAGGFIAPPGV